LDVTELVAGIDALRRHRRFAELHARHEDQQRRRGQNQPYARLHRTTSLPELIGPRVDANRRVPSIRFDRLAVQSLRETTPATTMYSSNSASCPIGFRARNSHNRSRYG